MAKFTFKFMAPIEPIELDGNPNLKVNTTNIYCGKCKKFASMYVPKISSEEIDLINNTYSLVGMCNHCREEYLYAYGKDFLKYIIPMKKISEEDTGINERHFKVNRKILLWKDEVNNPFLMECPDCKEIIIAPIPKDMLSIEKPISSAMGCPSCNTHIFYTAFNSFIVVAFSSNGNRYLLHDKLNIKLPMKYENISKPKKGTTISSYDHEVFTLRDALEGDEYAYYNLFGEFPDENDW